jgi:dienelactone hydrolase
MASESVSVKSVNFFSDGIKLAGDLYLPAGEPVKNRPAVVMLHGWTGIKNFLVNVVASRFAEAGYVGFAFDYRGYGESEGERHRLIPSEQVADARNAITFLGTLDEVCSDSIGAIGVSFGGGIGLSAASVDSRLKCLSCNGTVSDGLNWMRAIRREWEWIAFQKELAEDRDSRVVNGESRRVSPWDILLPAPDPTNFIENNEKNIPGFKSTLPLESAEAVIEFRPIESVEKIQCPVRLIHAKTDPLVPSEQSSLVYDRLASEKSLILLPVPERMDLYQRHFDTVVEHHLEWMSEHLPV